MKLTANATPDQVLMHHPRREHYDDIIMNPRKTWFGFAGPSGVLDAQDRVLMRRHIREFFPDFAAIVKVTELDFSQLWAAIERLRHA